MPEGFFNLSDHVDVKPSPSRIPHCGACGLYKRCSSPKMPYSGEGKRKVLILGEAPGKNEDERGIQFCGKTGRLLEEVLAQFDVDMRKDCWLTNSIICHPEKDRTPSDKELFYCLPNLVKTIRELKPEIIIPLGNRAVKSLLGWLWKDDVEGIARWDGFQIPCQELNAWICPTWHPSYILRNREESHQRHDGKIEGRGIEPLQRFFWEPRMKAAFELEGRPWKKIPDYKSKIKIVLDHKEAANLITTMSYSETPAAFDYETNMLKPDSSEARIVSCSLSNGALSVSFPWYGEVIPAMKEFLRSPVPKIGYNQKFEERWTIKEFGHGVRNWVWDGMLAAHVLDNRPSICSVEFQAFALLGQKSWGGGIKPWFKGKDSNSVNRIREINLRSLLEYNGMDALMEWKIAEIQQKQFKETVNG